MYSSFFVLEVFIWFISQSRKPLIRYYIIAITAVLFYRRFTSVSESSRLCLVWPFGGNINSWGFMFISFHSELHHFISELFVLLFSLFTASGIWKPHCILLCLHITARTNIFHTLSSNALQTPLCSSTPVQPPGFLWCFIEKV